MSQRGRKSAASLEVANVTSIARPDAPYDLNDEEADEWWAVVNRMPADWFPRETHGMLAQYCRHIVAARRVSEMIRSLEEELGKECREAEKGGEQSKAVVLLGAAKVFDRLYKMQEREGRAISSLATRMRISQQSTYDKSKNKGKQPVKRPWSD